METTRGEQGRAEMVGVEEEEVTKAKSRILVHFIPPDSGTKTNIDRRV